MYHRFDGIVIIGQVSRGRLHRREACAVRCLIPCRGFLTEVDYGQIGVYGIEY